MKRTWSPTRLVHRPYCLITTAKEWAVGWMGDVDEHNKTGWIGRNKLEEVCRQMRERRKEKIQVFFIGLMAGSVLWCDDPCAAKKLLWAYTGGCSALLFYSFPPPSL